MDNSKMVCFMDKDVIRIKMDQNFLGLMSLVEKMVKELNMILRQKFFIMEIFVKILNMVRVKKYGQMEVVMMEALVIIKRKVRELLNKQTERLILVNG